MQRDLTAGLAITGLGLAYATYAAQTLQLGSLRQMGPGMFPLGLGLLLALLGVAIALPALGRDRPRPTLPRRGLGMTLLAIAAFALSISAFGLVPAVIVTTTLAAVGLPGSRPGVILATALGLSVLTWAIFIGLLNLPIPLAAWPF